ncbi:MAG: response regulator transcription factor [bacterium]
MTPPARTIAVVDDEASVRVALGRLLRLQGYSVTSFASGEELLASLAAKRPSCIVLDVHLPGLSGFDVERSLRESQHGIPIVFITASDDQTLTRSALDASGARLLHKPFSSDALIEAVEAALANAD